MARIQIDGQGYDVAMGIDEAKRAIERVLLGETPAESFSMVSDSKAVLYVTSAGRAILVEPDFDPEAW